MSSQEIQGKLNTALKYHQNGQLSEAEIIYKLVIDEEPCNANAQNLYGILLFQQKRFDESVECGKKAVEIDPSAYFYINLGNAYIEKGDADSAIDSYYHALNLEPDNPKIFYNLAHSYKSKSDLDAAINYYNKAIGLNPSYQAAYVNLGNIYMAQRMFNDAIICYQKATNLDPNDASTYNSLGGAFLDINQFDEAIINLERAVKIKPDYVNAYINLGNAYIKKDEIDKAINCLEFAIELNPRNYLSYVSLGNAVLEKDELDKALNLFQTAFSLKPDEAGILLTIGNVYIKKDQLDEALATFNRLLELDPNSFDAYLNIGNTYLKKFNNDKVIEYCEKALELKPDFAEAYLNIGNAYKNKRDIDKSLYYFKKAVESKPDYADAHFNLGTTYLLNKDFDNGWVEYEWRIKRKKSGCPKLDFIQPKWDGSSLKDKTIYISYEQGYGDTIQFARFLPVLSSMGANVKFKIQASMEQLFNQSNLNAEIINSNYPDNLIKFDTYTYLMSLPYLLKLKANDIPFSNGYLKADINKVSSYKESYFNNDKFKVGIKWKGNPKGNKYREIPLKYFYSLANIANIKLYSLQKGDGIEQLTDLPNEVEIINLGDSFNDFSDTAAAIENLDLVISNDTSIAHLAGALGKQTWILISAISEWRWLLDIDTSPWYDSIRLFRQKEVKNWDEVFERVSSNLRKLTT